MLSQLIHIAREGKTLGSFEAGKISDQLDTGYLLPTDFYYDEAQSAWIPLADWKIPSIPPPVRTDLSTEERRDGKKSRSRNYKPKSRPKKGSTPALGGWIACLFALAVAAGIWVWAQTLGDRLSIADKEVIQLKETIESLERKNEILAELTPPNRIRAAITFSIGTKRAGLIRGAAVSIYQREDVEKALRTAAPSSSSAQSFNTDIETLRKQLPPPLTLMLTDDDGRVDIPIAQPGRYVLVATASKTSKGEGKRRYVWLIGFRIGDEPHRALLLDEKNASPSGSGTFEIKDVITLASGNED